MNNIYRTLWNEATRSWVAVAEIVKIRGKASGNIAGGASGVTFLLKPLAVALIMMGMAHAAPPNPPITNQLPTGGNVVAGQAGINQAGAVMNISQSSQRAAIDWQTFNVGSAAQVNFLQPSSSSVTLNRVLDSNPSQIFGRIVAPGQVFFTNPNGMYFASSASVDVGGLVATTHSINNDDFMAGNYRFTRNGATGGIINDGNLTASLGGYIALLAPEVQNNGIIVAQMGTVVLAAGEAYTLQFDGNNTLANILVTPATIAALVENRNAVRAPGGLIILSAQAVDRLQGGVVNNSGMLEATGLTDNGGTIRLVASDRVENTGSIRADAAAYSSGKGGTVSLIADLGNLNSQTLVDGIISARGGNSGGDGGFIETSATHLSIGDGTRVDTQAPKGRTGQWLLDPVDITIGTDVTGATIATALQSSNVTLDSSGTGTCTGVACGGLGGSNGNITVNDNIAVSNGSADTTLTLKATGSITFNASTSITRTGSYKLNTIFWADSDNSGNGNIALAGTSGNAVTLTTNGGGVWMGGSSTSTTAFWTPYSGGTALTVGDGYATGNSTAGTGIFLENATITTSGGNVALYGKTPTTSPTGTGNPDGSSNYSGIYSSQAASTLVSINSGAGTIYLKGLNNSNTGSSTTTYEGVYLSGTTLTSAATSGNAITVIGDATNASQGAGTTSGAGITLFANQGSNAISATGGGDILIDGTSSTIAGALNYGIRVVRGGSNTDTISTTNGGNIVIQGTVKNSGASYSVGFETAGDTISSSGNLTITGTTTNGNNKPILLSGQVSATGTTALTASGQAITATVGTNDFGGAVTVTGTTVQITDTNALVLGGDSSVTSLTATAGTNISGSGTLAVGTSATFSTASGSGTYSGAISGNGNITKSGNGTLVLSGNNTYSGTTTISTGTLAISNAAGLGTTAAGTTVANGATLDLQNVAVGAEAITLNGGTLKTSTGTSSLSGAVGLGNPSTISATSGASLTVSGAITASGNALTIGSGGDVTLSSASNNINNGVTATSVGNLSVTNNASLTVNDIAATGNLTFVASGDLTVGGNISVSGGSADSNLTLKATGSIVQNSGKSVSRNGSYKLNTIYWADSDASGAGYIQIGGASATLITTNGGHLWMGGGSGSTSWNGLTVGDGYAVGDSTGNNNGIYFGNAAINTGGGNIAMYGKSVSGSTSVNAPGENSAAADGLHFSWAYGNSITSGTGSIYMKGISQASISNAWEAGIDFMYSGAYSSVSQSITSSATSGTAITLVGDSSAASGNYTMGLWMDKVTITSNGGGDIALTGLQGSGTNTTYSGGIVQGSNVNSTISAGAGNITLTGNNQVYSLSGKNTSISGSGALTIQPYTAGTTIGIGTGAGTLSLSASYFSTNFANGFSNITVGNAAAGNITVGGAVSYNDNLTLKTANSINVASGASLTGASGENASLVLWSDADANSNGYIALSGAINTNGGHAWLGGGAQSGTAWNGLTVGSGSAWGNATQLGGINLYNGSSISTGAGNVRLSGSTAQTTIYSFGIEIDYTGAGSASISTSSGNIDIIGTSSGTNVAQGAVVHAGATVASTGGGNITIQGTGGTGTSNDGVAIYQGKVLANSGTITLIGNKGTGTGYGVDIVSPGTVGYKAGTSVTSSTSNINITTDTLSVTGTLQSSGLLSIQPKTAGTTIGIAGGTGTLALTAGNFSTNFTNGFSGITIGNSTAGAITVGGAITLNDYTTFITGGNIAINGALNGSGQTLTLTGGSGGTVSGSGNITASNLLLNGSSATYTLNTATGNSVGTLAASTGSGNISFYNNAALAVGTVGSTNGIITTGTVDVETLAGDLTVSQNIATTNTSASAIVLNAGRSTAALTTTGGNLIISGSPIISTGSGGTARLYSGSVAGSTGLTSLVGSGSGRFRYASDESATNYSTALTSGKYAIYREAPAITVQPSAYQSTYGATVAPTGLTVFNGTLQNGDSLGTISVTINSTGSSTSNVGTYDLALSGLPNYSPLGYALTGAANSGGHTISQRPITVKASDQSRTYGSANPTTDTVTLTSGTLANSDALSTATVSSTATSTTAAGQTAPLTPTNQTFSTGTAGNYAITYVDGTLTINPAPLILLGITANKTYGTLMNFSGTAFSSTGLQNGETIGSVTLTSAGAPAAAAVGSYAIVPGNATGGNFVAGNYSISYHNGTLTVGPAPLTVTANSASKTYNGLAYSGGNGVSYVGFVNGEGSGVLSGTLGYAGTSQGAINAGSYAITPNGLTANSNYTLTFVDGSLVINKAHLTVTADDKSRFVGEANPVLTATLSGFVNGENLASAGVGGSAGLATNADTTTPVGKAAITAARGTLTASNYDFTTFNDGTLTISAQFVPPPPTSPPPSLPVAAASLSASSSTSVSVPSGGETSVNAPPSGGGSSGATGSAGTIGSGGVSVSIVREPSVQQSGVITVSVPKEMATVGSGFSFPLPTQIAESAGNTAIQVTTISGQELPTWLKFAPETKTFTASAVPDGAFPMQVVVTIGGYRTAIVISERAE